MPLLRSISPGRFLQCALLALSAAACASAPVAPATAVPQQEPGPCVRIEDPDPSVLDGGAAANDSDGGAPTPTTFMDGTQGVVATRPKFVDGEDWQWTAEELDHRFQVLTIVQCGLPVTGIPEGCRVLLGFPEIDDARLVAYVQALRFEPAKLADGRAVGLRRFTVPVHLDSRGRLRLPPALGTDDQPATLDKWIRPPADTPRDHLPWTWTPEQVAANTTLDLAAVCVVSEAGKPTECRTVRRPQVVSESQLQAYLASLKLTPARAAEGRDVAVKGCVIEVVARPSAPPKPNPSEQGAAP